MLPGQEAWVRSLARKLDTHALWLRPGTVKYINNKNKYFLKNVLCWHESTWARHVGVYVHPGSPTQAPIGPVSLLSPPSPWYTEGVSVCIRCCCCSVTQSCLIVTPRTIAHQASLSFTVSQSLLKLMSIVPMIPSNHFIFCRPLLLLPSIFSSIRVFSNE